MTTGSLRCPTGKQPFRTKGKAIKATAKKSSLTGQPFSKIYHYLCPECEHWHRTRRPQGDPRREQA